jgi:hypothetical protein
MTARTERHPAAPTDGTHEDGMHEDGMHEEGTA